MSTTDTEITEQDQNQLLEIDASDPEHLLAVAEFIENMGNEALKLANRPHTTLIKTLHHMASELRAEQEVAEFRDIVDRAAEAAYDNVDPDQLSNPDASWDDLGAEEIRSWRTSIMASLRAIGAINVTDEQADRILAGGNGHKKVTRVEPVEPEQAEQDLQPEPQAQDEPDQDLESEPELTDGGHPDEEASEADDSEADVADNEADDQDDNDADSDTRAAVLTHTQPEAAPVAAVTQTPQAPQVSEEVRQRALAAQDTFGSIGMPPSPVNPPYPN